ncbi:arylamine N-acetyltransferase [Devosia sp.]|uniref:arylamine N-acetyltransferase family protein n=1 Tax=Devosia sp. TaxID=1871048 RepID=UPI0025D0A08C|nr:arylamine N-acetyltransferase [Devosia sp.]MCR6635759.1 arylamine N-acetyltransferase [Devosia sp.]
MPEKVNLNAYFERIGFAGSIAPTIQTLELLHTLHPAVIPFENIGPLTGEQVLLDQQSLEKKLLIEKRGGFCFEHNFLFMRILADLDYEVRPLLARVIWTNPEAISAPPSHMLLLVDIKGVNYIADVGFGGLSLTTPLRLRAGAEQATPHETFRLTGGDPNWTLEVKIGDEWRGVYVFTTDTVAEVDLWDINRDLSSNPASPFTLQLRASLSPSGRRLKVHNDQFTVQPTGGAAEKRTLSSVQEIRTVLTEELGLTLPESDKLDAKLAGLLPAPPETVE